MGPCTTAALRRGFSISTSDLYRIYLAFAQEAAFKKTNPESVAGSTFTLNKESLDAQAEKTLATHAWSYEMQCELGQQIRDRLEDISGVRRIITGLEWEFPGQCSKEPELCIILTNSGTDAQRWGRENYGDEVSCLGSNLEGWVGIKDSEGMPEVKKELFLDELGIELTEEWMLVLSID